MSKKGTNLWLIYHREYNVDMRLRFGVTLNNLKFFTVVPWVFVFILLIPPFPRSAKLFFINTEMQADWAFKQ